MGIFRLAFNSVTAVAADVRSADGVAVKVERGSTVNYRSRIDKRRIRKKHIRFGSRAVRIYKAGENVFRREIRHGRNRTVIAVVLENISVPEYLRVTKEGVTGSKGYDVICKNGIINIPKTNIGSVDYRVVIELKAVFALIAYRKTVFASVVVDGKAVTHGVVSVSAVHGIVADETGVVV